MSADGNIREVSVHSKTTFGLAEYKRPWKLCTLALGVALLILGSFYYEAPDWDIGALPHRLRLGRPK
jgi:hypothetical protein